MSYTALEFWGFWVVVLAGVALLAQRLRGPWLIAASLWFYGAPDPMRLVWLGGVMGLALGAGAMTRHRLAPMGRAGAIAALVIMLVWAKFPDPLGLPDPSAPPGLSFIVFTAIALIADSAGRAPSARLGDGVLHLAWFPKLLAGPIERAATLMPQLPSIAIRPGLAGLGVALVITGLIKKLVIADALGPVVAAAYAIPAYATPIDLLLASYAFAFQIYCDFSGYADIALGLSALVGLRLSQNFAQPYLATSVSEFWAKRWHITLGQWFRDYVYIPLGGSRRGRLRGMFNLMTVFVLSGLWHAGLGYGVGWGFLIWGVLNGVWVIAELWLPDPKGVVWRGLRGVLTFHLILLTWVFFRAETPQDALTILTRIATALPDLPGLVAVYPFNADQRFGAAVIGALMVVEILSQPRALAERIAAAPLPLRWAGLYLCLAILLLFGRWQDTSFIYAGF